MKILRYCNNSKMRQERKILLSESGAMLAMKNIDEEPKSIC